MIFNFHGLLSRLTIYWAASQHLHGKPRVLQENDLQLMDCEECLSLYCTLYPGLLQGTCVLYPPVIERGVPENPPFRSMMLQHFLEGNHFLGCSSEEFSYIGIE